jgi:hypothetical protein
MLRINGVAIVCALVVAGTGCSGQATGEEGSEPSVEAFEFAPEDAQDGAVAKPEPGDELFGKGADIRPFGGAYIMPVVIAPGQTVSYQTSLLHGGSNVDTVLALFRRHDNVADLPGGSARVGIQTLALNDDFNAPIRWSSLSYTNNSGQTENAYLMLFGYGSSLGWVQLSGVGAVEVLAGSAVGSGTAGVAFTSNTTITPGSPLEPDPWLYMFDYVPGQGNGAFNDDGPGLGRDSKITDATGAEMWYVASAFPGANGTSSGTTTINY